MAVGGLVSGSEAMNREFQELEIKEHLIEDAKQLKFNENQYLAEHTKELTTFDVTVCVICVIVTIVLVFFNV